MTGHFSFTVYSSPLSVRYPFTVISDRCLTVNSKLLMANGRPEAV
jgi:hypothetical protein